MADKKDAIDAEVKEIEGGEAKEEKKEKKGFFSKVKESFNNSMLEAKIESAYKKDRETFTMYKKDEMFSQNLVGDLDGLELTVWGKQEVKAHNVIIDSKDKAYYIVSSKETTVKSVVEGFEYERPGTIITLDDNVEEVKVVKAGKRYFLYKG
jgi:hypothetical protein